MLSDSHNVSNTGRDATAAESRTLDGDQPIRDKGGRRLWRERRKRHDTINSPDRRAGNDRRCGIDRRHGRDRRSPEGFRRILGVDRRLAYNHQHLINKLWS